MKALELEHGQRVAALRVTMRQRERDAIAAASLANDTGTVASVRLWYAARARLRYTEWQVATIGAYRYP